MTFLGYIFNFVVVFIPSFRWFQVELFLVGIDKWDLKTTWSHIKKASPFVIISHAFPTRNGNLIFTSENNISTLEECDLRMFREDVQGNGTRSWSRSGSHRHKRQLNNCIMQRHEGNLHFFGHMVPIAVHEHTFWWSSTRLHWTQSGKRNKGWDRRNQKANKLKLRNCLERNLVWKTSF